MVSVEFHVGVAYALSCVGRQDLTLIMKPKQEEALVVVVYLRSLHGVCLLGSRWLWVVVVLSVAGLRV